MKKLQLKKIQLKEMPSRKTWLRRLGIGCIITCLMMGIWGCGLDDYEDDDYGYETGQGYSQANGGNNQSGAGNGQGTQKRNDNSEVKQQLRKDGVIREPRIQLQNTGEEKVTVLLYMNGSNLESDDEEATTDLTEIVKAGDSDRVNVLVQTMGTKKWSSKYGIASNRSQRYQVNGQGLTLVDDDLGQLDCTVSNTLSDFIKWGVSNYPADRYILLFWNHGGGPIYGFGYDEWNEDEEACLSMDEMQAALREAGVYFDFIGMDCCIMSCMEVGCALYDYADYLILSEDFESGLGWSYTKWMKALYDNPAISTIDLGQIICDEMVVANEQDSEWGDASIMAVIDQSMMPVLYTAWKDFAYANEEELLGTNYSTKVSKKHGGRLLPSLANHRIAQSTTVINDTKYDGTRGFLGDFLDWDYDEDWAEETNMADYFVTDIMAVAQNIESTESASLSAAIDETLCYVRSNSADAELTGLSVTLPYGDGEFYETLKNVFARSGIDEEYIAWLEQFTEVPNSAGNYDYDDWSDSWGGWEDYDDAYEWNHWNHYEEDFYGEDSFGWDYFDYDDSYNHWYEENDDCFEDDCYNGDDFFYDDFDDWCYDEDEYGHGGFLDWLLDW